MVPRRSSHRALLLLLVVGSAAAFLFQHQQPQHARPAHRPASAPAVSLLARSRLSAASSSLRMAAGTDASSTVERGKRASAGSIRIDDGSMDASDPYPNPHQTQPSLPTPPSSGPAPRASSPPWCSLAAATPTSRCLTGCRGPPNPAARSGATPCGRTIWAWARAGRSR